MLVLGIETACDDTAAAVVRDGHEILSNIVWSQKQVHEKFGGVVPELAARRHLESINYVIQESLDTAGVSFSEIDAVGVNCKHGLLRSIVVGVAAAKAIAYSQSIPLIGVHHIEGHIYSNILGNPDIEFPHICLTVSGGHNLLIHVTGHDRYELIGRTLDDAAGEAFDKVSKLLGLGFPGGPLIDRLAQRGNPQAFAFPRPMLNRPGFDFSFSGLKTAVVNTVNELRAAGKEIIIADLAASFQQAVVDVLVTKTLKAAEAKNIKTITIAGGVSANSLLRDTFRELANRHGLKVIYPPISLCTDNGAMIAALAYHKLKDGQRSDIFLDAMANAPLGALEAVYKNPAKSFTHS
jgi:N6-L-threonylcarbamoyladenine synthase